MANTDKKKAASVTSADIQERGRTLQHTFRVAGIPQYTRWFAEVDPKLRGDSSRLYRIRRLCNGEGTREDLPLLEKCEFLVRTYLKAA